MVTSGFTWDIDEEAREILGGKFRRQHEVYFMSTRVHHCPDDGGYFSARKNVDGELYTIVYGETTSANLDSVEKKPLYHFYPGT